MPYLPIAAEKMWRIDAIYAEASAKLAMLQRYPRQFKTHAEYEAACAGSGSNATPTTGARPGASSCFHSICPSRLSRRCCRSVAPISLRTSAGRRRRRAWMGCGATRRRRWMGSVDTNASAAAASRVTCRSCCASGAGRRAGCLPSDNRASGVIEKAKAHRNGSRLPRKGAPADGTAIGLALAFRTLNKLYDHH